MDEREPHKNIVLEIGALQINASAFEVRLDGHLITLSAQDFKVLLHLAQHTGEIVSKDELWRSVWGHDDNAGSDDSIRISIKRLRQTLEYDPEHPACILTVHGVGYMMPKTPILRQNLSS
jgi:DNA-binding response OmpR family regulator